MPQDESPVPAGLEAASEALGACPGSVWCCHTTALDGRGEVKQDAEARQL